MSFESADMPARPEIAGALWRRPFLGWMDGIDAGWAVPLLLIGFMAVWLAFAATAFCNGDLHPDALESWSLGRSLAWGYAKHPPLAAWLAHAWTSVLPLTNWSFQLLALTTAALALWAVDLIAGRFVLGDNRIVVLLLLMLLPIYQSGFERFNADAAQMLTWPIATYCFLRSFENGGIKWAIAAGATAALAMLGKYHSVYLILSFAFAAVVHPQRRAYFASQAPWFSTVTGLAVLGPHLHWLATVGMKSFSGSIDQLAENSSGAWLTETLLAVLIVALALAIPLLIWSLVGGRRFKRFARHVRAVKPGLLLLLLVAVGTIIFPAIAAIALRSDLTPFWGVQSLFLFAIVIVCGTRRPVARIRSVNLAALVTGIALASVVLLAPLHALYRNFNPLPEGRNYYQLAAAELTRQWHAQSDAPLPAVGGDQGLALAAAFYSSDHPTFEAQLVRPEADRSLPEARFEQGWASLCFDGDGLCAASMEKLAARTSRFVRSEFVIESNLFGLAGDTQRFTAVLVPSGSAAPPAVASPEPAPAAPAVTVPMDVVASIPDAAPPAPDAAVAPAAVAPTPPDAAEPSARPSPSATAPVAAEDKPTPPQPVDSAENPVPKAGAQIPQPAPSQPSQRADTTARPAEPALPAAAPAAPRGGSRPARHGAMPLIYKAPRTTVAQAIADYKINWMRWAAAQRAASGCAIHSAANGWSDPCCRSCWSAARNIVMRGPLGCASRGGSQGCPSLSRAAPAKPGRAASTKEASSICQSGAAPRPLLARLAQPLCALVAVFEPVPPGTGTQRSLAGHASLPVSERAVAELQKSREDRAAMAASAAAESASADNARTE